MKSSQQFQGIINGGGPKLPCDLVEVSRNKVTITLWKKMA